MKLFWVGGTGSEAFGNSYFGDGSGSIFLDNVQCSGSETSLLQCPSNTIGNNNCDHFTDAGVRCGGIYVTQPHIGVVSTAMYKTVCNNLLFYPVYIGPCYDGEVRLEGANYDNEGRVQICYGNTWGTVCDSNWGSPEAMVVCSSLGFLADG